MANIKDQKGAQQVEETISAQEAFFAKYKKAIIYGVVAVVVIIAGIIVYNNYVAAPREDKASTILAKGQQLFGEDQYEKGRRSWIPWFAECSRRLQQHRGRQSRQPLRRLVLCKPRQVERGSTVHREVRQQGRHDDQPRG